MTPETITKLQEVFAPIAAKIGQGAEFGWEVVMRQQIVVASMGIVWAIFGLVGVLFFKRFIGGALQRFKDTEEPFSFFALAALLIVSIVFIVQGISDAITHFINPAYYALDFFIHLTK